VGLDKLLSSLPKVEDPNLLVGFNGSDDAGVYRISDDTALVVTADFITPPVNDPFIYGQIAAANAISDVYAMGGRPVTCINLVAFPSKKLPQDHLHQIVAGALSKITEAGAVLAGGHTIEDDEPKFGLSVTGLVHPERYWSNGGARPGDLLILTKGIGSGVIFNANLKGWVSQKAMETCIDTLCTLNRRAAEVMAGFDIHSATDITGFGLAGHGFEIATSSEATLRIDLNAVPVLPEALEMYQKGVNTGVNAHNRRRVENATRFDGALPAWHREIVFDPQTSGGLMVSVPEDQGNPLLKNLHDSGVNQAAVIGKVTAYEGKARLVFR